MVRQGGLVLVHGCVGRVGCYGDGDGGGKKQSAAKSEGEDRGVE